MTFLRYFFYIVGGALLSSAIARVIRKKADAPEVPRVS